MKTLVIHPADTSTDFLKPIYANQDWTVIVDPQTSKRRLREAINSHDRIIMLGHGTQDGLIAITNRAKMHYRYVISSELVYLLRNKITVGIWCNADVFFTKYDLRGFYTGMIISEIDEAYMYSVSAPGNDIDLSNELFAQSVKDGLTHNDVKSYVVGAYQISGNRVVDFNRQNIYQNSKINL